MIPTLGFVWACIGVGAIAAFAAWPLAGGALRVVVRRGFSLRPARRADAAFLLGIAPALVGFTVALATAMPSLMTRLGLAADHCGGHDHHVHVCMQHAGHLPTWLVAVGALASLVLVVRAGRLLVPLVEEREELVLRQGVGQRVFDLLGLALGGLVRGAVLFAGVLVHGRVDHHDFVEHGVVFFEAGGIGIFGQRLSGLGASEPRCNRERGGRERGGAQDAATVEARRRDGRRETALDETRVREVVGDLPHERARHTWVDLARRRPQPLDRGLPVTCRPDRGLDGREEVGIGRVRAGDPHAAFDRRRDSVRASSNVHGVPDSSVVAGPCDEKSEEAAVLLHRKNDALA